MSPSGKVYEIQAPGGWWGVTQALQELLLEPKSAHLAEQVADDLLKLFPEGPNILHLFDSAGLPHEHHFFAKRLRNIDPRIRFRGIDSGVNSSDCNFVRSHSYQWLAAEDHFVKRVEQLARGEMRFDHPPIPIFDQKLPMCMPFDAKTRSWFRDCHRDLFPFTSRVEQSGLRVNADEVIPFNQYADLPSARRHHYLKYAGLDTTRNFGSISVHALSEMEKPQLQSLFAEVTMDIDRGEPWILQTSVMEHAFVEFVNPDGLRQTELMSTRLSSFHGPSGQLAELMLAAPHNTVHGMSQTVVSLVTRADVPQ